MDIITLQIMAMNNVGIIMMILGQDRRITGGTGRTGLGSVEGMGAP